MKITFGVLDSQISDNIRRKQSGSKGSSENITKLVIQASDTHLGKVPVGIDYVWT